MLQAESSPSITVSQDHPDPAGARRQKFVLLLSGKHSLSGARSPAPAELQPPGRVKIQEPASCRESIIHLHEILAVRTRVKPSRPSHPAPIPVWLRPVTVHIGG